MRTGFFLGVGVALNVLAFAGTRHAGLRIVYLVAGTTLIVAAIRRLKRTN
jgi:hypothetical protein